MLPTTALAEFLQLQRAAVIDEAVVALDQAAAPHYTAATPEQIRARLEALFDRLQDAARSHDLGPALLYAEALAEERFDAGYDLAEIQAAINALEEATWSRIFSELDSSRSLEVLGLASTILGAIKDAMGRRYVSLAAHTHTPSLDLRALFSGTAT